MRPISILKLGGLTFALTSRTVSKTTSGTGTATATYNVNNNGTVTDQDGALLENWISNGSLASGYEVRATFSSGTSPSGTLGSWLNLGTSRSWSITDTVGGTAGNILVEIRDASSLSVVASATIHIAATAT